MSGDKKLSKDAARELIRRAAIRTHFQKKIVAIRGQFGIPADGFKAEKPAKKWYVDTLGGSWNTHEAFLNAIDVLLHEEKLPLLTNVVLQCHIMTSGKFDFFSAPADFYGCDVEEIDSKQRGMTTLERRWKKEGKSFIRLYIPRDASLSTVQKYLKVRWPFIRDVLLGKRKGERAVKRSGNYELDNFLEELSHQTRKELGLKRGEYRADAYSRMATKEFQTPISAEAVKKRLERRKKQRDS